LRQVDRCAGGRLLCSGCGYDQYGQSNSSGERDRPCETIRCLSRGGSVA
jgi:hypothetical protein